MHIAILGTRGIPAQYGGFETFAEELATRLVVRGHEVTVYGRRRFGERKDTARYRGVHRASTPTVMHKYLETPLHSLTSFLDAFFRRYDVILLCNAANSPFAWIGRSQGVPVAINVDGIERRRKKWNSFGRAWCRLGELASVLFASEIVADAEVIARYYRERYRRNPKVITYGASAEPVAPGKTLQDLGVEPGRYILYVSRLEPENNALGVVEAFRKVPTDIPLVIVGDAPYASRYKDLLRQAADSRVIFAGFRFGEAYRELRTHCTLYIQATEVGGTHPALVEAMAYGNAIIANRTPEHEEVLGDTGEYYPFNDFVALGTRIEQLLEDESRRRELGQLASSRAAQLFNWDQITTEYEDLFRGLVSHHHRGTIK